MTSAGGASDDGGGGAADELCGRSMSRSEVDSRVNESNRAGRGCAARRHSHGSTHHVADARDSASRGGQGRLERGAYTPVRPDVRRRLHAVRKRRDAQRPPGPGGDSIHDLGTPAATPGAGARDRLRTGRGAARAGRPPRARRADRARHRRRACWPEARERVRNTCTDATLRRGRRARPPLRGGGGSISSSTSAPAITSATRWRGDAPPCAR